MSSPICIICSVPYSEELEIVSLNCHHCFHERCIEKWFENRTNCPQCRAEANASQMKRVLLSFETSNLGGAVANAQNIVDTEAMVEDLKQQLLTHNFLIAEKNEEIEKLTSFSATSSVACEQNLIERLDKLQQDLENKDAVIDIITKEKIELQEMLETFKEKVDLLTSENTELLKIIENDDIL